MFPPRQAQIMVSSRASAFLVANGVRPLDVEALYLAARLRMTRAQAREAIEKALAEILSSRSLRLPAARPNA